MEDGGLTPLGSPQLSYWGSLLAAYLVVLKGRVVGGSSRCHLHGRNLGGLIVQMWRPLEEDKAA